MPVIRRALGRGRSQQRGLEACAVNEAGHRVRPVTLDLLIDGVVSIANGDTIGIRILKPLTSIV